MERQRNRGIRGCYLSPRPWGRDCDSTSSFRRTTARRCSIAVCLPSSCRPSRPWGWTSTSRSSATRARTTRASRPAAAGGVHPGAGLARRRAPPRQVEGAQRRHRGDDRRPRRDDRRRRGSGRALDEVDRQGVPGSGAGFHRRSVPRRCGTRRHPTGCPTTTSPCWARVDNGVAAAALYARLPRDAQGRERRDPAAHAASASGRTRSISALARSRGSSRVKTKTCTGACSTMARPGSICLTSSFITTSRASAADARVLPRLVLLARRLARTDGSPSSAAGARISRAFRASSGAAPRAGCCAACSGRATELRSESFTDELRMWDVAGYFYGRHIYTLARFSPVKSRRRPSPRDFSALRQHADELDDRSSSRAEP